MDKIIKIDLIDDSEKIDVNLTDNSQNIDVQFTEFNDFELKKDIAELQEEKADIEDIPTKVSQLENDAGYITEAGSTYDPSVPDCVREITPQDITSWDNKSDFSGDYNDLTNKPTIPTKTSDLENNSGFITKNVDDLTNYTKTSSLGAVALSNDYNDLNNKPDIPDVSNFVTKDVNDLTYYTLKTSTGSLIDLEINQTTYVITLSLKDQDGNVISTDTIDLPLESVVVGGEYDAQNQKIVLTLQNGNKVDIPVGALVAGLQTEITSQNKLASDLVDDSNSGNKFVTTSEKSTWNGKVGPTDYATTSTAGLLRVSNASGTSASNGLLQGSTRTYEQYVDGGNSLIISKGTLENAITGKALETSTNKVTSLSNASTDTQYPSAKCVYDMIGDVETILNTLDVGGGIQ